MYQDKALYVHHAGAGSSSYVDMACEILEQAGLEEVTGKWDPSKFLGEGGSFNKYMTYFNRSFKYGPVYFIPASTTKGVTGQGGDAGIYVYRPYTDAMDGFMVSSGSYSSGLGWQASLSDPYYMTVRLIKSDNLFMLLPLNNNASAYYRAPVSCFIDTDQNYHFRFPSVSSWYRVYSKNGSKVSTATNIESFVINNYLGSNTLARGKEEDQIGILTPYICKHVTALSANKLYHRFKRFYGFRLPGVNLNPGDRFMLQEYNYVVVYSGICYRI